MSPLNSFLASLMFYSLSSLLITSPKCHAYNNQQKRLCEPFDCGPIKNISYPFRSATQSIYCGHPGFDLDCQSDALFLNAASQKYRVLEIDPKYRILKMVRFDLFETTCPENFNTTDLDPTPLFSYSDKDRTVTLLYDCDFNYKLLGPAASPCSVSNKSRLAYLVDTDNEVDYLLPYCGRRLVVHVMEDSMRGSYKGVDAVGEVLKKGFEVQWKSMDEEKCMDCVTKNNSCGFNPKSEKFMCLCSNESFGESCNSLQSLIHDQARNIMKVVILIIGVITGGAIILLVFIKLCYCKNTMNHSKRDEDIETFIRNHRHLEVKRYRFSELKQISGSFKDKLGQGGYGEVYRGTLSDGRLVAIKLLKSSKGNGEEFVNEVASVSRTSHVNIVSLLGFCLDGGKRALVYELMPNGSLEKFIHNNNSSSITNSGLEWDKLMQIATGIARGLEYLHRGCNTRILHFNIKPHNILLDEDFRPKISDFGLAKLCPDQQSNISLLDARGTVGYIAPEVFNRSFGAVSSKSDVYSYGMMILEMVSGRKNIKVGVSRTSEIYFPDWIYDKLQTGTQLKLWGDIESDENGIARKMILVGLWCIQIAPSERPSMSKVIEMLEGSIESLKIPPKPTLFSPTESPVTSFL